MNTVKITKTEKYEMIIAELAKTDLTEDTAMLVDFCKAEIDALARKAEKAKERKAAKDKEADSLYNTILGVLENAEANTYITIPAILAELNDDTITAGKLTPRLATMIENGIVEKKDITTPDKRKLKGYMLVK